MKARILRVGLMVSLVFVFAGQAGAQAEPVSQVTSDQGPLAEWPGPGEPPGMGYLPTPPELVTVSLPPALRGGGVRAQELAASVDLSAGMPPVKSQGSQGSCSAWAAGYYYKTYQEGVQHTWDSTDLNDTANQRSPAYLYNQRLVRMQDPNVDEAIAKCNLDLGWNYGGAMAVLSQQGVDSLSGFPYDQNDACTQPNTSQRAAARPYRSADYGAFFVNSGDEGTYNNDIAPLKAHLDSGDAFVISIPIYYDFYKITGTDCDFSASDVVTETYVGGHGVAVVGYDDNHIGDTGYFKIINSWGTTWCYSGYGWLSYDFVQQYVREAWWMTDIPWDAPSEQVYLPLVVNNYPAGTPDPGIYGQITQNGTPVAGATVWLQVEFGGSWYTYLETTTDASGNYRFTDVLSLGGPATAYGVTFINDTHTPGRVWQWLGDPISSYTAGANLNVGTYEVSDIALTSPADPYTSTVPVTFQWIRRSYTSDDYELWIYDGNFDPQWATEPSLGYASSYNLTSLSGTGLTTGTPYNWDLIFYGPNGIGWSLDARTITFVTPP